MTTKQHNRKTSRKKRRKSPFLGPLRHVPRWMWWSGAVLVAVAYVFVMYVFMIPSSRPWKARYSDAGIFYPEGFEISGLDISHYQGRIDWVKLRNATIKGKGLRFVIVKSTEGKSIFDDCFNDNFYQARQNGFIRGAYHFYSPDVSAEEQADWFLRQVHLEEGDLFPVFDVEMKSPHISDEMFKKEIYTWLNRVGSHYGVKPILYTSYKFKLRYLNDSIFNTYPYWIAHYYVDSLTYSGNWDFWQHTDCGRVDGIKGMVDLDVFRGTEDELLELTIKK